VFVVVSRGVVAVVVDGSVGMLCV